MQIFVRNLANQAVAVDVEATSTVEDVKQIINQREGVPAASMTLSFAGKVLAEEASMEGCGIASDNTLTMSLRLNGGGKVHGSLARAGKVKGQTPKVQKQDRKKKKPTGRAKKRMQYNRRFVNVVASIGKRVGPNNNAARIAREEAAAGL